MSNEALTHLCVCLIVGLRLDGCICVCVFVYLCLCIFVCVSMCLCICGISLSARLSASPLTLSGSGDAARESGCLMLVPDAADHVLLLLNHLHQQKTLWGQVSGFTLSKEATGHHHSVGSAMSAWESVWASNTQPAPTSQSFTKTRLSWIQPQK